MIVSYVKSNRFRRVAILSDNDRNNAGLKGAQKLSSMLPVLNCIFVLPTKDIREFVNFGGNLTLLNSMTKDLVWKK